MWFITILISLSIIFSYLIGSIPFGYIIGKCKNIDIRKVGSGNIGATNVTRNIGIMSGVLCFIFDFLKGYIPTLIFSVYITIPHLNMISPETQIGLITLIASSTILGHIFPIYMKFKGGKGISTSIGSLITICPMAILFGLITWFIIYATTKTVGLASILYSFSLLISVIILYNFSIYSICFITLIVIIIVIRHKENMLHILKNGIGDK